MSASHPVPPEPTEIAGRFQVVRKLGAGAFGTVYKVKDKVLGRMLAIKTIRLEGLAASQAGLKEMLDRFNREARVAAQLRHPNIVTIYDIGEADGLSYISMELIDGVGLDSIIAETGRMAVPRAAALAAQVADALDYAHQHGVVHRDIKPANIMVEAGDRVKVTDFGIAKPGDSAEHLTMTGSLLGTPSYMSPEQARGQKLDGRSDLFSLGCVIYEMVAGRKAFRGDSITALLFKILTEEPQSLRELDPSTPEEIVRVISRAIAKTPDARYQSGRELADELLALTKPSYVPTLRNVDSPTLPPDTQLRTINTAPTIVSDATTPRAAATGSTRPASPPPPLPTIVTPPPSAAETTAGPSATTRGQAAQPAAPPQPAKPLPKKGRSGVGLLLGLAAVALVVFGGIVIGGWALYKHRQTAAEPASSPTPVADTSTPMPAPGSTPLAEATPASSTGDTPSATPSSAATPAPSATPVVAASSTSTAGAGGGRHGGGPAASTQTGASGGAAQKATGDAEATTARADETRQGPPPGDYSFLNEIPADSVDGRAAGEELAQKYRAGGSTGITGRRFAARSRVPRDVAPLERPAVATLLHLMFAEQAYQRAKGRYGSLDDLKSAGLLRLDVPLQNGAFERARYRFEISGGGGEFKARATPLAQGGRPFVADDNGYVLVDE